MDGNMIKDIIFAEICVLQVNEGKMIFVSDLWRSSGHCGTVSIVKCFHSSWQENTNMSLIDMQIGHCQQIDRKHELAKWGHA